MRLHSRSIISTLTLFLSVSAIASLPQSLWMRSLSSGNSDYMGSSLASGKLFLAAGAPSDSEFGPNNGSVLIYRGQYSLQYQQVIWGRWQAVHIDDERALAGAPQAADGQNDWAGIIAWWDRDLFECPSYNLDDARDIKTISIKRTLKDLGPQTPMNQ